MTKRKRGVFVVELPCDEVLIHLFLFLTPKERLTKIEPINKYFKSLLLCKMLWRNINLIHVKHLHPSFFIKYGHLISFLKLEHTWLSSISPYKNVNHFSSLRNIKHLNLLRTPFVRLDLLEDYLDSCASPNCSLKYLYLPKMYILSNTQRFSNNIFSILSRIRLKLLSISFHKSFFESDYSLYIWSLASNNLKKYIRKLQFLNFPCRDNAFITTMVQQFQKLKHINLDFCQLNTHQLNTVMAHVSKHITVFQAKFIEFNVGTMQLLSRLKDLRELTMCHVMHSNKEYKYLSTLKNLENIDIISGSAFDFTCIENCKNLKQLTILRTRIINVRLFWDFIVKMDHIKFILSRYIVFDIINNKNKIPSNVCLI